MGRIVGALALERDDLRRGDARYCMRRRVDFAEMDAVAEAEIIGMEQAAAAARQHPVAQRVEQPRLHVGAEIIWLHADIQLQLERYIMRIVEFKVLARHAIAIHERQKT